MGPRGGSPNLWATEPLGSPDLCGGALGAKPRSEGFFTAQVPKRCSRVSGAQPPFGGGWGTARVPQLERESTLTAPGLNELRDGAREWRKFYKRAASQVAGRRTVMRAGTALAIAGSGGLSAFLAACSGDSKKDAGGSAPSGTSVGGGASITGDWDTTKTPPYTKGLSDELAKVPEQWKQYPWVYKYGPWRYNWDIPVARGGTIITPWAPAANYDVMLNGIGSQPCYNKLYNAGLREGLNLIGPAIEPDLALSEEHNADYTSWSFKIPANAKFHNIAPVNGRAMTAEDVAASLNAIREQSVQKATLRVVDKITAPDKETVRFDLKQPSLNFTAILASPHLLVIPREILEDGSYKKQPVGSGPFMLKFSEYQNRADFVRNPDYWETPRYKPEKYGRQPFPMIDQITRQYFANNVTAKEAFFAGKIDQLAPGGGLDTALVREQLDRVRDAIVMSNAWWSCCPIEILFQYKNPLFQDIRIRQALSLSVNREQVWSGGMDKTGIFGSSPVPPEFAGYDFPQPLKDYGDNAQFDPRRAKQLLQEAGHNQPLKLQVYQPTNYPTAWQGALDTAIFNWKQAGIADVTKVERDAVVFQQDQVNKSFPDLMYTISGMSLGYTIDTLLTPALLTGSPANYSGLADSQLDSLLEKWSLATDPAQGVQLARQITARINENVDNLWLGWIGGIEVDRAWAHGLIMSTHNQPNGIGLGNYKYLWIDPSAPDGRGGKPL
jgi:peptide/nickel transport system substrate-binding protein